MPNYTNVIINKEIALEGLNSEIQSTLSSIRGFTIRSFTLMCSTTEDIVLEEIYQKSLIKSVDLRPNSLHTAEITSVLEINKNSTQLDTQPHFPHHTLVLNKMMGRKPIIRIRCGCFTIVI